MGNQLDFRIHPLIAALLATVLASAAPATPVRHDMHVAVAEGVNLRVVTLGDPTAKAPVVLIPGWTIGLEAFLPVAGHLARDRQIILYDSRSQGGSSIVTANNTPEDRAQDLHALIARLRLKRPYIIAWSQGVQDLAAFVQKYGDGGLSGSVLVDALPSGGAADAVRAPKRAQLILDRLTTYRGSPREYEQAMMQFIVRRPQANAIRDELTRIGLKTPQSIGADMLIADLYGIDRSDVRFTRPALMLAAGTNAEKQEMQDWAIRRGTAFAAIANAAHAIFIDQPDAFVARVRSFMDRN